MRARHKAWALPFLEEHPEIVLSSLSEQGDFFSFTPLYLEIGSGKGDFALTMAEKGGHWLCLERETSVAGIFAKKLVTSQQSAIRIYPRDFDAAFPEMALRFSFDGLYLNFSDPWPKKKHWKRRLTTAPRLKEMASLLKPAGFLFFKSDNDSLYEFTKVEAAKTSLILVKDEPDYAFDEAHDAQSEYERAFRQESKPIHRLIYRQGEKE